MKKSLFFAAAASALMLTACSSENDVVQNSTNQNTVAVQQQAVGFDVYTPAATNARRAGRVNVMTNKTMQKTGFGVYGHMTDNGGYTQTAVPNFMWNQQVFYNSSSDAWYYSPLKYWPNETNKDSQTTPAGMPTTSGGNIDKLTFFAYAPWVQAVQTTGVTAPVNSAIEAPAATSIARITGTDGKNADYNTNVDYPHITYKMATDPNESVDLLWGVAPAGGISYTNVSGGESSVKEGMPLIDLVKPAVNTSLKFMFQHALARLGVKVIAAVDQVAAGGILDYGNTKITIEKIEIKGNFATKGYLNLKNTDPNVALWQDVTKATGEDASHPVLTIEAGKGLAPHLIYSSSLAAANTQQTVTGVTTTLADAIKVSSIKDEINHDCTVERLHTGTGVTPLTYSATTPYFGSWIGNNGDSYVPFNDFAPITGNTYFHKFETKDKFTDNEAFTILKGTAYGTVTDPNNLSITYPTATVWENIYRLADTNIKKIASTTDMNTYSSFKAYRLNGLTFVPTGQNPQINDFVFVNGSGENVAPVKVDAPVQNSTLYTAVPNYFMIIPTNSDVAADKTLTVKITYYVSTTDASLANGIVYTKNEVEKAIVLPHLKNGVAYNLKLILGLTSVKLEAEVADWVTNEAVINLPQNTSE